MSVFPPEIINDILLRLPPKALIRSTCVSKCWYALIHDHRFITAHLQRSLETNSSRTIVVGSCTGYAPSKFFSLPFNDGKDLTTIGTAVEVVQPLKDPNDETIMLGYSVNGLVCIRSEDDEVISLWNPSIQRFKTINSSSTADLEQQQQQQQQLDMEIFRCTGFGYDSVNDDYKIVDFAGLVDEDDVTVNYQVNVYSLKSNSWKTIQNNMPCECFRFISDEMLFLNGSLCWLMCCVDYIKYVIVTLDLAMEKYREFPAPIDVVDSSAVDLKVLRGSLCICVNRYGAQIEFWTMTEYGVTESWTVVFSIEHSVVPSGFPYCHPLMLSNTGEMLLLKQFRVDRDRLYWYDLEKKSVIQVEIRGLPYEFNATSCTGSLCLLDGDPVVARRQQVNHLSNR